MSRGMEGQTSILSNHWSNDVIRILEANGRSCPLLMCDVCGERILSLKEGAAVFRSIKESGSTSEVMHVHKRECHNQAEKKMGDGKKCPWQELQDHFYYVLANSESSPDELKKRAESLGNLGLL